MIRISIERSLTKAGWQATGVGDGKEGLLLAQQMRPDAILLDMMLPSMDGTAVLRELKRDPATASIPVVVLSGLSQRNEEKLITAGASAYFEKSTLNLEDNARPLINLVRELVAERKSQRSATGAGH